MSLYFDFMNQHFNVSRETYSLLEIYVAELLKWQKVHNLIANSTIEHVWQRHIFDSLQLIHLAPENVHQWVDIGSGGGLPGLVIAIVMREQHNFVMHLVESSQRKCAFLQHCVGLLRLPVFVHAKRIQDILPTLPQIDVLSARALASLDQLFEFASKCRNEPSAMLFLKGKDVNQELTDAQNKWRFGYEIFPSRVESSGCVVSVRSLSLL